MAQAAELYAGASRDWSEGFLYALNFGTPAQGQEHVTVAQARAQADSEVNLTLHRVAYETAREQARLAIALLGIEDADQSDT